MYQKTRKIARICREREGERERASSPRKRFPLWGIKGELFRTSSFHPSSRRNRNTAGHRTLHLIIFALFHTYIHIHAHPRGRCERSVFTKDWLTYVYVYVYVYVCVSASLPPPWTPLTQNRATIQKNKKQLLLSCLPTISIMISTITSRKQSLGRLSLFPGPLWTTIYVFIYPESHHQTLHTKRPPSPFRPLGHGADANTKFNTRRTNNTGLERRKKGKRERKEKRRKKDTKHCIFLFLANAWMFFSCYFSFLHFKINFSLKTHELNFPFYMIYRNCLFCDFPPKKST